MHATSLAIGFAFLAVLAIIYIVPFGIYASLSAIGAVATPEGSPGAFLFGVLVSKTGTAIAFVAIFFLARESFGERWVLYAFLWWLMLALGEIGQAIGPNYTWTEAIAGIVSEAIYCPAAAFVASRLLAA